MGRLPALLIGYSSIERTVLARSEATKQSRGTRLNASPSPPGLLRCARNDDSGLNNAFASSCRRLAMDISSLALFAGVYFLAVASPGPAIAALVARSLSSGFRRSLPFLAGIVMGDLVWFTLTALGLSVLMQSFHGVFVAIKYAGCAYLLYLAWKAWTAPAEAPKPSAAARGEGVRLFLGGIALTLGNPKV